MQPNAGIVTIVNAVVDGDAGLLFDKNWVSESLYKLAEIAEMEVICETPVIVPMTPDKVNSPHDDGGISIMELTIPAQYITLTRGLVISTSTIHIHTWPLQKRFRLILDSCKDYDVEKVKNFVRERFNISGPDFEAWQIMGYAFPKKMVS